MTAVPPGNGVPAQEGVPAETRSRLFGIAYRMLGSAYDAEDAVQEAFLRWHRLGATEREAVRRPEAWLTTVVSRICLDQLGSARARRESYTGVWLPEPLPGRLAGAAAGTGQCDPADVVTLEESVSMALLVVMESLTPAERVAFVLHDVFGLSFAEVADVVGRTPQACRQLASSARRHVRNQRRYATDGPDRRRVVEAFARACASGDVEMLVGVLDPQVVVRSDGGGKVTAATRPVVGAGNVARFLLGIVAKVLAEAARHFPGAAVETDLVLVNAQTGLLVRVGDRPVAVVGVGVDGERVAEIDIVVNPDKLAAWAGPAS